MAEKMRKRLSTNQQKAMAAITDIIIRDSDPYVPMATGATAQSPMVSSQKDAGIIIYDTPYARKIYYGNDINFSHDHHPKATARWFEHAKSEHGGSWVDAFSDALTKGVV